MIDSMSKTGIFLYRRSGLMMMAGPERWRKEYDAKRFHSSQYKFQSLYFANSSMLTLTRKILFVKIGRCFLFCEKYFI